MEHFEKMAAYWKDQAIQARTERNEAVTALRGLLLNEDEGSVFDQADRDVQRNRFAAARRVVERAWRDGL